MSGLEWLFLVCFILAVHSESAENILVVNDQGGVYLHFCSDSRRFQTASRSLSVYNNHISCRTLIFGFPLMSTILTYISWTSRTNKSSHNGEPSICGYNSSRSTFRTSNYIFVFNYSFCYWFIL